MINDRTMLIVIGSEKWTDIVCHELNKDGFERIKKPMQNLNLLKLLKVHFVEGALNGVTQPSVIASTKAEAKPIALPPAHASRVITELPIGLGELVSDEGVTPSRVDVILGVMKLAREILVDYKYVSEQAPQILEVSQHDKSVVRLRAQIACTSEASFTAAVRIADAVLHHHLTTGETVSLLSPAFRRQILVIRKFAPPGFNTSFILKEAQQRKIPWIHIAGNVYQLGAGAKARLFNSSETDKTSSIGTKLATNKLFAHEFLRKAGFPVVPSLSIRNEKDAKHAALQIGFPVVVKPQNTEGGKGVAALLDSEAEVGDAFNTAQTFSKSVLVEKHFAGNDYRIHVVLGEIQGVIHRDPAHIIADGIHTVAELVDTENNSRLAATDDRQYLHAITLNQEAKRLLARQGLTVNSRPQHGLKIKLRAAASISTGGEPSQIDLNLVHPDNAQLCIDICKLFHLDIAGVDLLIPNIEESWRDSGAHICEVNHKPQMFTTLFAPMFDKFFDESAGQIPLWIVMEPPNGHRISRQAMQQLSAEHDSVCWVSKGKRNLGGRDLSAAQSIFETAQQAMLDTSVEALIVTIDESLDLSSGWPFPYCDRFIEAHESHWQSESASKPVRDRIRREIIRTLKPSEVLAADANYNG